MNKTALAVLVLGFVAAPAAASVMVVGNSPGVSCYQAAQGRNSSITALESCDGALAAGTMDLHDTVATYVNRGIIRVMREDYQVALADFDRAIALDPNQPESYLNKGSTLLRMGAPAEQAIPLLDAALAHNTRRPELAYFSRAIAHEMSGDVRGAYEDYRRAQQAAPKWEDPARELTRFQVVKASSSHL